VIEGLAQTLRMNVEQIHREAERLHRLAADQPEKKAWSTTNQPPAGLWVGCTFRCHLRTEIDLTQ
jgi:hypothetical protein